MWQEICNIANISRRFATFTIDAELVKALKIRKVNFATFHIGLGAALFILVAQHILEPLFWVTASMPTMQDYYWVA